MNEWQIWVAEGFNTDRADTFEGRWELAAYLSNFDLLFHQQTRRVDKGGPRQIRYATYEPDGRVDGSGGWASRWFNYE